MDVFRERLRIGLGEAQIVKILSANSATNSLSSRQSHGKTMADDFVSAALAALNDSAELRGVAWISAARAANLPVADRAPVSAQTQSTEDRFAAAVCSGMAKSRLNAAPVKA